MTFAPSAASAWRPIRCPGPWSSGPICRRRWWEKYCGGCSPLRLRRSDRDPRRRQRLTDSTRQKGGTRGVAVQADGVGVELQPAAINCRHAAIARDGHRAGCDERSEERRVGKECRYRGLPDEDNKKRTEISDYN